MRFKDKMMRIKGELEDICIAALDNLGRRGNFRDDAGGIVGKAPMGDVATEGVYLVFLVRCTID